MTDIFFGSLISGKIFRIILALCTLVFFISLIHRDIQTDENWLGEQSYWFLQEGQVKLKSIPFILNWSEEFLVYHKGIIWIGAVTILVFGWSVYSLKIITLVFFLVSVYIILLLLRKYDTAVRFMALLLLITVPLMFLRSFEFRPEVFVMSFGLASYFFISKYFQFQSVKFLILSATLAALAFLCHLNGVIFCVSGFLILVFRSQFKNALVFGIICAPIASVYFWPLIYYNNLGEWWNNLRNWPSHSFSSQVDQGVWGFILKLITEHKRFFWGPEVIGISVLFLLSLITRLKYLWKNHSLIVLYLTINIVALALLGSHKASRYLVYHLPFMAVIISLALTSINKGKNLLVKYVFSAAILLELSFFFFQAYDTFEKKRNHSLIHRELSEHIEKNSSVIAPWNFIYNEIDNYDIYNFKTYEYLQEQRDEPFTALEILEDLNERQVDYLILNRIMKEERRNWFKGWDIPQNTFFKEVFRTNEYLILKRNG